MDYPLDTMEVSVDGKQERRRYSVRMPSALDFGRGMMPTLEPETRDGERVIHTVDGRTFIVRAPV